MNDNDTVASCFAELSPVCDKINDLVRMAPLSAHHRAGLALMVAVSFRTAAALALQEAEGTLGDERAFQRAFEEVTALVDVAVSGAFR